MNPIYKDEKSRFEIISMYRKSNDGIFIPAFSAGKDETEETLPAFYPKHQIENFDELLDPQTMVRNIIAEGYNEIYFGYFKFLYPEIDFSQQEKLFIKTKKKYNSGMIDYEQKTTIFNQIYESILSKI